MKISLSLAGVCLGLLLLTSGVNAADNSPSIPPEGATIQDAIGDAADSMFGVWTGRVRGQSTPCELTVSDYYAGYSGDTSPNPIKVRKLLFTVSSLESSPDAQLIIEGTDQYLAQKGRNLLLLDASQPAGGFGSVLRQYSKIALTLNGGQPTAARAEAGSINFGVIVEKRVDLSCVDLKK